MSTTVEQIKSRLNVADVIGAYVELNKAGNSLKGKCPFHNEKTPSFFVSPDRGTYYCFGCGAKGDIFSFVEQFEGLDFKGALKVLADKAGVEIVWSREERGVVDEKEKLYEIMEESTKFFEKNLEGAKDANAYLVKRGLKPETIKEFRLGLALSEWRTLHTYLRSKGYSDALIEKAGLAKMAESGKGYYDRFRGRIIFPIFDSGGRVIAFTGRILVEDEQSAKYLNSPETPLFIKANILYGIDKAKSAIRQKGYSVFVEGQMDLILCHQAGYKNIVAGSGTALTDSVTNKDEAVNNFGIIRRLSNNIIFVYDADEAGQKAAERSAEIALSLGMDVKIASLPDGLDPADAILKDVEIWKNALKNANHVIEFVLEMVIKTAPDERRVARMVSERVLPLVSRLDRTTEQAHFIKIIKEKTGISEEALGADVKKFAQRQSAEKFAKKEGMQAPRFLEQRRNTRPVASTNAPSRKDSLLVKAIGMICWQTLLPADSDKRKVDIEKFKKGIAKAVGEDYEVLEKNISGILSDAAFEAEAYYSGSANLEEDSEELLMALEEDVLKRRFAEVMKEIVQAERSKNESLAKELLVACQEITKKLEEIAQKRRVIKKQ
ncbi:MAG: DNA primase [Candidatus Taylorbacteria bacterium]|nr:DNA primase [Candidatus Taylorbacteria bacterium]